MGKGADIELKKEKLWNSNYLKVWCANFMIFFSFMLLTPLFPLYLSETFGADKQMIGIVLSGYTLTALIIRPFSGYLVDSFPRRVVLLVSYALFCALFLGYIAAGSLVLFAIVRTLHGAPFGASTVSNSTVAIDVLHPTRRAEGIGYYGLSNNIATAIGPTVALMIYGACQSYDILFWMAFIVSAIGLGINWTLDLKKRETVKVSQKISLDRFILLKAWSQGICMICYAFSYGVLATYIAIYGKNELGITGGTGMFFMLLSIGLILSRLVGNRTLREGKIVENASIGVSIAVIGYLVFAALHNHWGYYGAALIIGLGNGHMFPAFQTMFLNLASNEQRGTANSTLLVSWDIGVGLGILAGGSVAEHLGYYAAFWTAFAVNLVGVILFLSYSRQHFIRNRVR
ncbi:MAG: MFS transporter [Bacteroidales bacterium]|nr:MFS transporter [Bacteroidales bacterium]